MKIQTTTVGPPKGGDQLHRIIAAVLGVEASELSEQTSPEVLSSWDSVNHLNIVMALESEFGISLSAENALAMRNVGCIRTILRNSGAPV